MSNQKIQKRGVGTVIRENGQYALAVIIVASMLFVTSMPVLVLFFFGIFAFLVFRKLSTGPRNETREIFEFYLAAHEILRDDDRKWYGFEIKETIDKGEEIVHAMSAAPPLMRFTLGALHSKFGDHKAAVSYLSQVVENPSGDELAFVFPTAELRSYVRILRRIEREPANAPLTSAAIRALERARKLRGPKLLEVSREAFASSDNLHSAGQLAKNAAEERHRNTEEPAPVEGLDPQPAFLLSGPTSERARGRHRPSKEVDEVISDRQSISEVLHDIYDRNH